MEQTIFRLPILSLGGLPSSPGGACIRPLSFLLPAAADISSLNRTMPVVSIGGRHTWSGVRAARLSVPSLSLSPRLYLPSLPWRPRSSLALGGKQGVLCAFALLAKESHSLRRSGSAER